MGKGEETAWDIPGAGSDVGSQAWTSARRGRAGQTYGQGAWSRAARSVLAQRVVVPSVGRDARHEAWGRSGRCGSLAARSRLGRACSRRRCLARSRGERAGERREEEGEKGRGNWIGVAAGVW
jgi:hypothetical protein